MHCLTGRPRCLAGVQRGLLAMMYITSSLRSGENCSHRAILGCG